MKQKIENWQLKASFLVDDYQHNEVTALTEETLQKLADKLLKISTTYPKWIVKIILKGLNGEQYKAFKDFILECVELRNEDAKKPSEEMLNGPLFYQTYDNGRIITDNTGSILMTKMLNWYVEALEKKELKLVDR